MTDRIPPHDDAAETALIGSLVMHNDIIGEARPPWDRQDATA